MDKIWCTQYAESAGMDKIWCTLLPESAGHGFAPLMDDLDTIAKIALYDRPQLLEVLGIYVRS